MRSLIIAVGLLGGLADAGAPACGAVVLRGEAGQSVVLTAADIAAAPRGTVSLTHAGKTAIFEGARLDGLLGRVDAPLGQGLHGPALADVIVVTAADGYRVALALAEADPGVRKEPAILADREDGAALKADGPYRLVIGGDLRPARAARSVVEIDVRRLP